MVSIFFARALGIGSFGTAAAIADEAPATRTYENRLVRIDDPQPLLADHPEFVQPVVDLVRYEAPPLVVDEKADLSVRAWRWSYNARGIIEIPNRLESSRTALVVVHPWGIDDGQGWQSPEPAGCADFCTPTKNHFSHEHITKVLNPFVKSMRPRMGLVLHSQPGAEDPIRKKLYRSFRGKPTAEERAAGQKELEAKLKGFDYNGGSLPEKLTLSKNLPAVDYFRQFPGLDAGDHYNNPGFWSLPIPVVKSLEHHPDDVLIYDSEGYPPLRDFLKQHEIRHVLLTGYATDMCFKATTAGYQNLRQDFNVFLVGDATLATFPANSTPAHATNASLSFASLENLITQISWIKPLD
ncbi:MAG: cysteine hydrolase family protein [Planctomycetota bacterium]